MPPATSYTFALFSIKNIYINFDMTIRARMEEWMDAERVWTRSAYGRLCAMDGAYGRAAISGSLPQLKYLSLDSNRVSHLKAKKGQPAGLRGHLKAVGLFIARGAVYAGRGLYVWHTRPRRLRSSAALAARFSIYLSGRSVGAGRAEYADGGWVHMSYRPPTDRGLRGASTHLLCVCLRLKRKPLFAAQISP